MYKLLIVDDEIWIRQRLAETIDWASINVEVVGTAGNGGEALKQIREWMPDIVITDIRMPGISGIELMQSMKESGYATKVILLSGYGDFEYAKEAIRFGAYDYILKPVTDENLLDSVRKCIQSIRQEREEKEKILKLYRKAEEGYGAYREKILLSILLGEYCENNMLQQNMTIYSLDTLFEKSISRDWHICILIHVDSFGTYEDNKKLGRFIIQNMFAESLNPYGTSEFAFLPQEGKIICVLSADRNKIEHNESELKRTIEKLKEAIWESFKITLSVSFGSVCDDFLDISLAYSSARQMMKYRKWRGPNRIYDADTIAQENPERRNYNLSALKLLLNQGKTKEAENEIRNIYRTIGTKILEKDRVAALRMAAVDIEEVYYQYFCRHGGENYATLFRIQFWEWIDSLNQVEDLLVFLNTHLFKMEKNQNKGQKISRKTLEFVEQHYMEALSLNDVAEYLELNPSYLCRTFKNEMGISFVSFLQNFRIEKAVELMGDKNCHLYEIGSKVGYENQQYFCKVFKSVKGVSPAVYRETRMNQTKIK